MPESAEFRNHAVSPPDDRPLRPPLPGVWPKIKLVLARSVFWSYERGTWQYDIILLVILAFIFLTPLRWYRHPANLKSSDLWHEQGFVEVGRGNDGWRYLISAQLVHCAPPQPCDGAVHEVLRRRMSGPFRMKSIEAIQDKNNAFVGYSVVVEK